MSFLSARRMYDKMLMAIMSLSSHLTSLQMATPQEGSYIRWSVPTAVILTYQAKLYLGSPRWVPSRVADGEDVNTGLEHVLRFADMC